MVLFGKKDVIIMTIENYSFIKISRTVIADFATLVPGPNIVATPAWSIANDVTLTT